MKYEIYGYDCKKECEFSLVKFWDNDEPAIFKSKREAKKRVKWLNERCLDGFEIYDMRTLKEK